MQPGTSAQPTEPCDHGSLWSWVKEHRPEVAAAAEAHLNGHSARLQLPCCSCPVRVPAHQMQSVQDLGKHSYPVTASPNALPQSTLHAEGAECLQAHPKSQAFQEATFQTPPSPGHSASPNVEPQSSPNAAGAQCLQAHPKSQSFQEATFQTPPTQGHSARLNSSSCVRDLATNSTSTFSA